MRTDSSQTDSAELIKGAVGRSGRYASGRFNEADFQVNNRHEGQRLIIELVTGILRSSTRFLRRASATGSEDSSPRKRARQSVLPLIVVARGSAAGLTGCRGAVDARFKAVRGAIVYVLPACHLLSDETRKQIVRCLWVIRQVLFTTSLYDSVMHGFRPSPAEEGASFPLSLPAFRLRHVILCHRAKPVHLPQPFAVSPAVHPLTCRTRFADAGATPPTSRAPRRLAPVPVR